MTDNEDSLAVRAAWLHYIGGFTQSAVAKRLGIPSVKAHRLIARAVAEGVVKVSIDGDIAECVNLEVALSERYGLDYCEVAPDVDDDALARQCYANALRASRGEPLVPIVRNRDGSTGPALELDPVRRQA